MPVEVGGVVGPEGLWVAEGEGEGFVLGVDGRHLVVCLFYLVDRCLEAAVSRGSGQIERKHR